MRNILRFSLFTITFSLVFCAIGAGAKHIDFEHHFVSTNYFNYVAERTEPPMYDRTTGFYYSSADTGALPLL